MQSPVLNPIRPHPANLLIVRKLKSGYLVPLQDVECSFCWLSCKNLLGEVLAGRCFESYVLFGSVVKRHCRLPCGWLL